MCRWGTLMGPNKAFDTNRFFIFCANALGSPYGSASPVTTNPETGKPYGPSFPQTTIRDDVRIHKLVLDALGVESVAVALGGSMGGMASLEWPLCSPPGYVKRILPVATCARHSAWGISWGEVQRQTIYSDPRYGDGWYTEQPASGLAAARLAATLTYGSRDSFEYRFGRSTLDVVEKDSTDNQDATYTPRQPFSAQFHLREEGEKFVKRFDANCYVHITHKLDTHDIARGRVPDPLAPSALPTVLATLPERSMAISMARDTMFPNSEQQEIADGIKGGVLAAVPSLEGHDGFLLEVEAVSEHVGEFLRREFGELYVGELEGAVG